MNVGFTGIFSISFTSLTEGTWSWFLYVHCYTPLFVHTTYYIKNLCFDLKRPVFRKFGRSEQDIIRLSARHPPPFQQWPLHFFPRDPITLSDDDWGLRSPSKRIVPFSVGDWIPRVSKLQTVVNLMNQHFAQMVADLKTTKKTENCAQRTQMYDPKKLPAIDLGLGKIPQTILAGGNSNIFGMFIPIWGNDPI